MHTVSAEKFNYSLIFAHKRSSAAAADSVFSIQMYECAVSVALHKEGHHV